jgi:hypothetical protein
MSHHIVLICSSAYFPSCLYRSWNYLKEIDVIHTMPQKLVHIITFKIFQLFYQFLHLVTCFPLPTLNVTAGIHRNVCGIVRIDQNHRPPEGPELLSYQLLSGLCTSRIRLLWQVTTVRHKLHEVHVGLGVLTAVVTNSTIFSVITLRSPLKSNEVSEAHTHSIFWVDYEAEQETSEKQVGISILSFTLISCSTYSSALKMEVIYTSETSVDFQRTIRRYIPQDGTLQYHNM